MNPITLLIVDDEPDMELLLRRLFHGSIEAGEFRLLFASNGEEALALLQTSSDIRVVLCDIHMPGMDGLTLLTRLRTEFPLMCPIMMSADGNLRTIRAVMNQGAYDFLIKPLDLNDLKITVAKAIRQGQANYQQAYERQQAEAARQQSAQQYRALLEQIDHGVAVFQQQALVFCNTALSTILEATFDQLRHMDLYAALRASQAPLSASLKEPHTWQISSRTLTGRTCWLEIWQCAIQWKGEQAVLLSVRDVTEYKLHELHLIQEDERLREENIELRATLTGQSPFDPLVGESAAMQSVQKQILVAAANNMPVMLTGESGTGKEVAARLIHRLSTRVHKRFIPINCAAIVDHLFESELFGHCKGAFTGASADKSGLLAQAHQGTLFLDEVGELSLDEQVKLLRVIEDGEYRSVGSTTVKQADIRLITATNRNLVDLLNRGQFREDLFYRLHGLEITMPPLRERKEDLPALIAHFLQQSNEHQTLRTLPKQVLQQFYAYDWPGNVRELRHVVSRYLATHEVYFANIRAVQTPQPLARSETTGKRLDEALQELEKRMILQALEQHHWHRERAAAQLGIPLRTFRRKINHYQILAPYQRTPASGSNAESGHE